MPMSLPGVILFFLTVLSSCTLPSTVASPLSTVAISHVLDQTVVCALIQSTDAGNRFALNCTSLPLGTQQSYPSRVVPYSAIAAGDGFLCALTSPPSSNLATMRWWEFSKETSGREPKPKRIYKGKPLVEMVAGDSHVCGILSGTREAHCWRWPKLPSLGGENLTGIAVGGNFVCGLSSDQTIKCFGNDTVVVNELPKGRFRVLSAGTRHACAVSDGGAVTCWGVHPPKVNRMPFEFVSLALGNNRTCALDSTGKVQCWGYNFSLPDDLRETQFLSIQANGRSFCGILVANYSLVCWGSEVFKSKRVVFNRVLPGPCSAQADCTCGILSGSGNSCSGGAVICNSCKLESRPTLPSPRPTRPLLLILLGSLGFGMGLAAVSGILFFRFCKRSRRGQVHDSGRLDQGALEPGFPPARTRSMEPVSVHERLTEFLRKGHSSTIEKFPLRVLLELTDGFSEEHRIGSGSFGNVYRAVLDDGREVAIKRARRCSSSSHAGGCPKRKEELEQAFLSELALLSRVNHKNLVRLLGFCSEGEEHMLVCEFMANGTLHDHLHKLRQTPLAAWDARLRVALDAARGIEYLHKYAVPPIIHRDIKSSNILLDDVWTAKVSDFGLSLMGPEDDASHISLRAAGTVGYMDPEYYRLQCLTAKSDVYSFGVVLLELLTGFKAIHHHEGDGDEEGGAAPRNVVDFAVPHVEADQIHKVLDPRLPPPKPSEIEAVQCLAYLAADCVSREGRDRPTMTDIVGTLERVVAACSMAPPLPRSMTTRSA